MAKTDLAHIAPDLRALAVEAASIFPDPDNVRLHGRRNLEAIRASLSQFGQQRPVIVDGDGRILAGNGVWLAAQELGWRHLAAARTNLGGPEARTFALADNRTAELSEWSDAQLAAELDGLLKIDPRLASATGFDDSEINALLAALSPPASAGGIVEIDIPPEPPTAVWILLEIPLDAFAMARPHVVALEGLAGVRVETSR